MTAFPKYDRYKDSGVEWLGEIPEHWQSEKGKWLFLKMDRQVRPDDGVVTAFRDGQVTLRTNRRTDGFTNAIKEHGYQGIRKGDLVIHAMDAFAGAIGVSESDGKSTPVYSACVPRKPNTVTPELYAYLLRYMAHSGFITTLAKGIRERSTDFRFNDFGSLDLPLPPKPEQDRIVAFLDQKTAEIDALIAKKQRQIELLDEQKAILINRAVTRGLNPNLSSVASAKGDAKLKPSGIEWIDEIPEHWERKPIKNLLSSIDYGTSQSSHEGGEIPVLSMANIQNGIVTEANAGGIDSIDPWLLIRKHDILFTRTNGNPNLVGKVGIVTEELPTETTFASYLVRFRTKSGTNPVWLHRLLWSEDFWRYARSFALINLQTNLNSTKYVNLQIAVPPFSEQMQIAKWCDELVGQEKLASRLIQEEIQALKTLRSTLIAHAVTGRIKV